tara:strand:- start:54 stop:230 length:177 start_codon:yes stop_codon:yes gene_type:complete
MAKTATITNYNLTLTAEELALVGDNQILIRVFEDSVEINTVFVDTVAEADAYVAALNE